MGEGTTTLADRIASEVEAGHVTQARPFVVDAAEVDESLDGLSSDFAARLRDLGYALTVHRDTPIMPDHIEFDGVKDEAGVLLARPKLNNLLSEPDLPLPRDVVKYIQVRVAAARLGVPEESDYELFKSLEVEDNIGFGNADHGLLRPDNIVMATNTDGEWTSAMAVPYTQLSFSPNMQSLHYGSADFEGMSAEWDEDGKCNVFGMELHHARLNRSNIRLGLQPIPLDIFKNAIITAIQQNARFIPRNGRLYIRPHCADIGAQMRVGNSRTTGFFVEVTPIGAVGAYFGKQEANEETGNVPMRIMGIPDNKVRAAEGQGDVKAVGGYAQTAPVIKAVRSLEVGKEKIVPDGVLYLDRFTGKEEADELGRVRICETNASNTVFFEDMGDGRYRLHAPSLKHGDILPGNNRALALTLAKRIGWEVVERDMYYDELTGDNPFCAAMNAGTATMLSPFDAVHKVHIIEDENGIRAELTGDLIKIRDQEDVNAEPTPRPIQILLKMMMDIKSGRSGEEDRDTYLTQVPGIRLKINE